MRFKRIIKLFESGNVFVTGLRGTGKDVLFGNVITRRDRAYVSNMDYGGQFCKLRFEDICLADNKYTDFINGTLKHYEFPYPRGSDIYISDAGVYLPSQFCNELNKNYQGLVAYLSLSRQVSHNNNHYNVQHLARLYDKAREQGDIYIRCRKCFVLFGFVFQLITIYDKYQSCLDRVNPCRVRVPMINKEARIQAQIYRDNFFNQHGEVKNHFLFYRNKSKHDTYLFEKLLSNGGES